MNHFVKHFVFRNVQNTEKENSAVAERSPTNSPRPWAVNGRFPVFGFEER